MPEFDRSFLAPAILGLIATSCGIGAWSSSVQPGTPHSYPRYVEATPKRNKTEVSRSLGPDARRVQEREPCQDQRSREESELCAQWQAAKASRDSADWAEWQFWLSMLGALGLGATLWFNLEAWRQARSSQEDTERALFWAAQSAEAMEHAASAMQAVATRAHEANNLAEQNAKRRLRPFIGTVEGYVHDALSNPNIYVGLKNFGQTPAVRVQTVSNVVMHSKLQDQTVKITQWLNVTGQFGICEPGHSQHVTVIIDRPIDRATTVRLFVEVTVTFEDLFDVQRWRRMTYELNHLSRVIDGRLVMNIAEFGNEEGEGPPSASHLTA